MIITNGVGITTLKNGVAVKQALSAANSTVNKGVYDATLLETVDPDLAAANILQPVEIFGKVGTVVAGVDVSDADALVTDVKDPKTFYSVAAPRKTGTMPTVTLAANNPNYPTGYHAGAAGLSTIEASLAAANIKSGINIFGFAGPATVQDIADADLTVAEAPTGKKFYAVTGGVKTGTGTKTLDPANDTVAAGYYAATTLHAVDADLAAANIKSGVQIFGVNGTYSQTLSQDLVASAATALVVNTATGYYKQYTVTHLTDYDVATTTQNFAANSMAVGVGYIHTHGFWADVFKLRLYMDGVQVAESGYFSDVVSQNWIVVGTRALSGNKICKIAVHSYHATNDGYFYTIAYFTGDTGAAGIGVGSIKLT